jgi:hypothetical protein
MKGDLSKTELQDGEKNEWVENEIKGLDHAMFSRFYLID